jgi:hypothetical protein
LGCAGFTSLGWNGPAHLVPKVYMGFKTIPGCITH